MPRHLNASIHLFRRLSQRSRRRPIRGQRWDISHQAHPALPRQYARLAILPMAAIALVANTPPTPPSPTIVTASTGLPSLPVTHQKCNRDQNRILHTQPPAFHQPHPRPLQKSGSVPRLPRVSGSEAVHALQRLGFEITRQRGSHIVMRRGSSDCVVPIIAGSRLAHSRGVLRQAGVLWMRSSLLSEQETPNVEAFIPRWPECNPC